MTRDEKRTEFRRRFKGRHLLFLTEAWSIRKLPPSEAGQYMDGHSISLDVLMDAMFEFLVPAELPAKPPAPLPVKPANNGQAAAVISPAAATKR